MSKAGKLWTRAFPEPWLMVERPASIRAIAFGISVRRSDYTQALWVLVCKRCKIVFTHTDPGRVANTIELLLPEKPELPADGTRLACPQRNAEAIYRRSDLKYHFRLD